MLASVHEDRARVCVCVCVCVRERERESLFPLCVYWVGWGGVRQVLLVCNTNTNLSVILILRITNLQLGEGQVPKFFVISI